MSRHHFVIGIMVAGWCVAWWLGSVLLAVAVTVGALIVLGLGVAFPKLRIYGPYVCFGRADRRQVALTFDDGPDPRSTPALLDLLREAGVVATFFCVGRKVAEHPELAARIVREGHQVENHSFAHSNHTNFFTVGRLRAELTQAQDSIEQATGQRPQLFRPPMGLSNPRVFRAARALNLKVIGWTARGLDTKLTEPVEIVERILKRVRPGGILLLHDGNIPAERLVATVRKLLDKLRDAGYEIVRLDRILE
ncbi:MAG: Peptidoglycan-N-acetylglucosamine deacetylase [Verrucomicrobiae bacterium]|nr:Peptidoglycan-N-acetylglucosamine deacetylase [Verrucomicrobiae bacterium]